MNSKDGFLRQKAVRSAQSDGGRTVWITSTTVPKAGKSLESDTMHPVLECAICAVLVFLVGALLFAAGAVWVIIDEGVQARVHPMHRTLESTSQTLPRLTAIQRRHRAGGIVTAVLYSKAGSPGECGDFSR